MTLIQPSTLKMTADTTISKNAKILIAVAALGYFVDVYDLILFGVVRNPSLASLGLNKAQQLTQGLTLFNIQMAGILAEFCGEFGVIKKGENPYYLAQF